MALPSKLFTDDELMKRLDGEIIDTDKIDEAREIVTDFLERTCRTAFIERTVTDTLDGAGKSYIALNYGPVREITQILIDNVAQALSNFEFDAEEQILEYVDGDQYSARLRANQGVFPRGRRNVKVTYKYGNLKSSPTEDDADREIVWPEIKKIALELGFRELKPSDEPQVGRSLDSVTTDDGGSLRFSKVDNEHPTGVYWIDQILSDYRRRKIEAPEVI
jgi:hypothetical protein